MVNNRDEKDKVTTASLKFEQLKKRLQDLGSAVIAYSGGVDSTFLVKTAYDVLGNNVIAVTATSSTYPKAEFKEAERLAHLIGVRHLIIESEETDIDNFKRNPLDRCFYCKNELFSKLKEIAAKENLAHVLDGTNYEDFDDYRPGLRALRELDIISPLAEVKLTKKEIRYLSKNIKLDTWDKQSFACLASRFPYGTRITKRKLKVVEEAENVLRNLGMTVYRVRYHNEIARIEVDKKDFQLVLNNAHKINKKFRSLGFKYITLDLKGYRTGSLNEGLVPRKNEG